MNQKEKGGHLGAIWLWVLQGHPETMLFIFPFVRSSYIPFFNSMLVSSFGMIVPLSKTAWFLDTTLRGKCRSTLFQLFNHNFPCLKGDQANHLNVSRQEKAHSQQHEALQKVKKLDQWSEIIIWILPGLGSSDSKTQTVKWFTPPSQKFTFIKEWNLVLWGL